MSLSLGMSSDFLSIVRESFSLERGPAFELKGSLLTQRGPWFELVNVFTAKRPLSLA